MVIERHEKISNEAPTEQSLENLFGNLDAPTPLARLLLVCQVSPCVIALKALSP